jgi:hypothetical protein
MNICKVCNLPAHCACAFYMILRSDEIVFINSINVKSTVSLNCSSYIATDGQSASLSWCRDFYYCRTFTFFMLWAPSLTRGRVCNLLVFTVILEVKSLRTHDHILLSHLRLPQPGGPGPRIYIHLKCKHLCMYWQTTKCCGLLIDNRQTRPLVREGVPQRHNSNR